MCLIVFGVNAVPGHRLVVAANRDEFYARKTEGLHRWDDPPIFAGRDRVAGGTWMGVSAAAPGRFAAVTNVRDGEPAVDPSKRSRGRLPIDFLVGEQTSAQEAAALVADAPEYAPVNLIVDDGVQVWWATNWPEPEAVAVSDGVHGVSNGALDSAWPKVQDTAAGLARLLERGAAAYPEEYFALLGDQHRPDPDRLPDTGVGPQRESELSPAFVRLDGYGTRASTVVRIREDGHGDVIERRFSPAGAGGVELTGESRETW